MGDGWIKAALARDEIKREVSCRRMLAVFELLLDAGSAAK